ncbi:uncharacterized protein N7529_001258 [Penicillium soppii]|uniref:uncharacterized protein n=1 Tax=Penicillium soppii TaxID=69789 RepID=UPI0025488964|nr:uncharacterized protein N7529_001258 [Penicillium soppii]KAJ5882586.1 hypothetical protein N7529_001258 [Penicillium soppii]
MSLTNSFFYPLALVGVAVSLRAEGESWISDVLQLRATQNNQVVDKALGRPVWFMAEFPTRSVLRPNDPTPRGVGSQHGPGY